MDLLGLGMPCSLVREVIEGNPDNPQGGVEESYSLGTPVIPFGIGIKYHLRERLFLALEMGFRPTVTDFLDIKR
ncbi:hypothetical protein QWY93_18435 [Echinicola jeungdonensis]|uniref:hypothetical protein n=1 Tax=Echinicola jeungdonensis TaxID=709343 RepID=UPI0025B60559|nr:hypothetical protein [Echinicola jeungdonensis]MDN3671280.1 hypothetical protein [Echinicola jeungdonensis]